MSGGERTDCGSRLLSLTNMSNTVGVHLVTVFTVFCERCQHNAMTDAPGGSFLASYKCTGRILLKDSKGTSKAVAICQNVYQLLTSTFCR